MKEREKAEIDRIVSEIADAGATADRISRLESLLLDRPDLQAHYASMIRLGTLLRCEIGDGSLQPFAESSHSASERSSLADHSCAVLLDRVGRDLPEPYATRKIALVLSSLAAMVIVGIGIYSLLRQRDHSQQLAHRSSQVHIDAGGLDQQEENTGDSNLDSLRVHNVHDLEILSRLTRTEAINCLWLPRRESKGIPGARQAGWELSRGNAWIDASVGGRERGYVINVPPGVRMDLSVDTDASCKNALGMVELNKQGRFFGTSMSFNNLGSGNSASSARTSGCIGQYSIRNDEFTQRNFLIAGSYCVERPDGTGGWRQSDFALLHESPDFLVIGFDDSGYPDVEIGEAVDRDRDFNDVCAFIHFTSAEHNDIPARSGVSYVPNPLGDPANCVENRSGYVLDVRPGEKMLMAVSSSASLQNSVRIIEKDSRQVIWQHDGSAPDTRTTIFQQGQRGIYVIYNDSDTVRSYEVQGRCIDDNEGEWIDSPFRVTDEGDDWVSIGFEDSPEDPKRVDWNDIRVHARRYSD